MVYEKIEASDRFLRGVLTRGTGTNIIKNLAEIIKNADDSYDELQQQKIDTTGIIEVGFIKNGKRGIDAFCIRDYGIGMSREEARQAFGKKSYGEDTSKNRRNGAIGVGGKDALLGMIDIDLLTIKDRVPTLIHIKTEEGLLHTEIIDQHDIITTAMSTINNQMKAIKPLNLSTSGTFLRFKFPDTRRGIRFETLKEGLKGYYTLRNITNGKNKTKLRLIDMQTGEAWNLITEQFESELLQKETIQVPHLNSKGIQEHYQVDMVIKRAKNDLDHSSDTGQNFLIETDQGGILGNHMFDSGSDPAAAKIFGNIIIHRWKALFREDPGILPENREGLLWSHEFNKQIDVRLRQYLKPILDQERKKLGSNPKADKTVSEKMKTTLSFLNKLMKDNVFEDEPDEKIPPEVMEFSSTKIKIVPGKTKTIKLFINPNKIPPLTEITTCIVEGTKAGCIVNPTGVVKTPDKYNYPPDVPYIKFEIDGEIQDSTSNLKAYFQDKEAQVKINVVSEEELYPTNGFAFIPPSIKLVKKKEKKIKIWIDTHIFPVGTIIELSSEDERIELPFKKISVSKPNLGEYLAEEIIPNIKCDTSKIQTEITAKACDNTKQERTATCKVNVIEKEESKVFFKDVKLDPDGDIRERARYSDGVINIHTRQPVLEHYFGVDSKNIMNNSTNEAVAILADTVLSIALRQMAIKRMEDGSVDVLDESRRDEEIELERKRLEQQYGKEIHQHLTRTYRKTNPDQ